jgi:hypothetical protein
VVDFGCTCIDAAGTAKLVTSNHGTTQTQLSCSGLTSPTQCLMAAKTGVGCTNTPLPGEANSCDQLCAQILALGGLVGPVTSQVNLTSCF